MITMTVTVGERLSFAQFKNRVPEQRGVYLVYRVNREDGRFRLIYIGKSNDLSERVDENHEHFADWLRWAYGDVKALRFSWILLPPNANLAICEEALIFTLRPPINCQGSKTYNHEDTMIEFVGRLVCNRSSVIAKKTC